MKVNEGEVPQYYIEQSHQPIIDPEEFDKVQAEFVRRKGLGHRYSGNSFLPPASSAVTAAAFTAPKSGTPTASTAALSGSATASSATR